MNQGKERLKEWKKEERGGRKQEEWGQDKGNERNEIKMGEDMKIKEGKPGLKLPDDWMKETMMMMKNENERGARIHRVQ